MCDHSEDTGWTTAGRTIQLPGSFRSINMKVVFNLLLSIDKLRQDQGNNISDHVRGLFHLQ